MALDGALCVFHRYPFSVQHPPKYTHGMYRAVSMFSHKMLSVRAYTPKTYNTHSSSIFRADRGRRSSPS